MTRLLLLLLLWAAGRNTPAAQTFFFGNDLSYVNEMEDCGVVYKQNGQPEDPYKIFADNGCNLVRLRLWHTPAWLDTLNAGHRYSDFQDVRKSILRSKALGMKVLLDFHLSDAWADPSKQLVPAAWLPVVNNLPVLKDSLYNYVSKTLLALDAEGLLPEMVQIGNETNKGICLSPQQNAVWTLDWNRNSQLFKTAIQAVRDVENATGKKVKIALHVAGPADTGWLMAGFWSNGVKDFDVIGISYYWAWHKPTTIVQTGDLITQLRQTYPGKEVMIFETGYIWTTQNLDNANNIINDVHPNYAPASPANQKKWLVDLTQEVISRGGSGVIYWEPAWVSSPCWTPWGQGSHQEHAAFFDFTKNVLPAGGMGWMKHPFLNLTTSAENSSSKTWLEVVRDSVSGEMELRLHGASWPEKCRVILLERSGRQVASETFNFRERAGESVRFKTPELAPGIYFVSVYDQNRPVAVARVWR